MQNIRYWISLWFMDRSTRSSDSSLQVSRRRNQPRKQNIGEYQDSRLSERAYAPTVLLLVVALVGGIIVFGSSSEPNAKPETPHALAHSDVTKPREERSAIPLIAVSEDGEYVDIAQGRTNWVRRDAHTGRELETIPISSGRLMRLQFSGNDEMWVGLNLNNQLEVTCEGESMWQGLLPEQDSNDPLVQCVLCPTENLIAVASKNGSLWLLKYNETCVRPNKHYSLGQPLADAKASPAGKLLLLVTSQRQFLLWDLAQERVVQHLTSEGYDARFGSWSGDGRRLVTFGQGRKLSVWDVATGKLMKQLSIGSDLVISAELSPDGKLLAVGEGDVIRVWDLEAETESFSLVGHQGTISALQFADSGRTLFSGDLEGALRRWSLLDHREIWLVR